ncbi:MAG: hypothetical protein MPL62_01980 [Alphaproteobacteria bacterium]|nr:hypothetical protein [Alphaproteobacteria bacterium]
MSNRRAFFDILLSRAIKASRSRASVSDCHEAGLKSTGAAPLSVSPRTGTMGRG